jgi:hypothetical protein
MTGWAVRPLRRGSQLRQKRLSLESRGGWPAEACRPLSEIRPSHSSRTSACSILELLDLVRSDAPAPFLTMSEPYRSVPRLGKHGSFAA